MATNMFQGASKIIFENARKLRDNLTKEEEIIWSFLKTKPNGIKFRRQHPIAIYIADFYCHKLKLIIEIDGEIHLKKEVKENDIKRQNYLEDLGIKVIRFSNKEVLQNSEKVFEKISKIIFEMDNSSEENNEVKTRAAAISSPLGVGGAFILAAGLGTRLKPWTDHHPKALAVVNGKSLLQRNIKYLQSFGIKNVVVNVHHFANQIIEAIESNQGWGSTVQVSDEIDEVLETGGGLLKARPLLENSNDFLVMNCDILTNLDLDLFYQYHTEHKAIATVAVAQRESTRNLLFNQNLELVGWRNNATGEEKIPNKERSFETVLPYAFSGVHILSNKIFGEIPFTGKFSMIDLYLHLCKNHVVKAYNHTDDIVLDVGKPEAIAKAEQLFL